MSGEAAGASFAIPDSYPAQTWFSMHSEVMTDSLECCQDLAMCVLEWSGGMKPILMIKLSRGLKSVMSSWALLTNLGQSASILVL